MSNFVLMTDDNQQLGFLLILDPDVDPPEAGVYDCILMGIPFDGALFDDPRAVFILDNRHREFQAEVRRSPGSIDVRIVLDETGWIFVIEGGKRWSAVRGAERLGGKTELLVSSPK